jgi:hypothetical protein
VPVKDAEVSEIVEGQGLVVAIGVNAEEKSTESDVGSMNLDQEQWSRLRSEGENVERERNFDKLVSEEEETEN